MKTIKHLVLGDRGFIGEKLVKFLVHKGEYVLPHLGLYDLREYQNASLLISRADYVWHMAADMGGIGYFSKEQYYPTINNLEIDINVLQACKDNKVKRLFYPASACAYPKYRMEKGFKLSEYELDMPADPDQMYGWEKLFMLKLMQHSPVDVRIGVLHTIYGEGQAYDGEKAKFPPQMAWKAIQALQTNEIEVWGDGNQTRTFLHVDDAVEKIYKVMMADKNHTPVNIGSEREVSVNDVVTICMHILGISPQITHNLGKPTGVKRRLCSNDKFNKWYGEAPERDLEDGFKSIINWIRNKEKL